MIKYDFHMHSDNSLDGRQSVDDACRAAIEKGLRGIAITDHADICFFEKDDTINRFKKCIADVNEAKRKYDGQLEIYMGIEMAEYLTNEEGAENTLALTDYDVVLGSIHTVYFQDIDDSYSRIDFSSMPKEKIIGFIDLYFDLMLEMLYKTDFDILTHLTCPLRYINGKYKRDIDIWLFESKIRSVLREVIDRGISLEINTSGYSTDGKYFMPEKDILSLYYEMGGRRVSIGSDAHISKNVSVGFNEAKNMLTDIGFDGYYVYKKREPIFIVFNE
ncbi:MAG: histidinol-phosphatase HisJ family protein [Clostridia bacterium]|nr:histidinol-phosphatase HisJ family protein [Clostridia bacterium]